MSDAVSAPAFPVRASWLEIGSRFASCCRHAGLLAVLAFAVCFLQPLLDSGFFSDDIPNSCTAGLIRLGEGGLQTCIENHNRQWMENGRFFPVAVAVTYAVHAHLVTALPYKCFLLTLVLANLVEFYWLLRVWNVVPAVAQLGTLSVVLLLQMRMFPDPVLSFSGILQILVGEFLVAAICLQKYLDTQRTGWLIGSVLAFAGSLVTYEISYVLLPVFVAMAYARLGGWRAALAATRAHWVIALLLAAYVFGLRFHIAMTEDHPYRLNLNPRWIFDVIYRQSSSALPLSYTLSAPFRAHHWSGARLAGQWENWAVLLIAAGLTAALCRAVLAAKPSAEPAARWPLVAVGCMMWILPALPIALSTKYHRWVHAPGVGYLPVYVQYFGVALLAVAGASWLATTHGRLRRWLAAGLVAMNACIAIVTFDSNRHAVGETNRAYATDARLNVEAALAAGVCAWVPEGATILTTRWHPWLFDGPPLSSGLFSQFLERRVQVVNSDLGDYKRSLREQLDGLEPPSFVVAERALDRQSGFMLVGPLESPADDLDSGLVSSECTEISTRRYGVRNCRIYLRGKLAQAAALTGDPVQATGAQPALALEGITAEPGPRRIRLEQWTVVASGPGWALYEASFPAVVDVATVELRSGPLAPAPRLAQDSH